ncbi:MAG TPA: PilN domain-containing protein [Terriglobales bacterium]|nr:PilN domain-containing protein [Terriglobales bacterium]
MRLDINLATRPYEDARKFWSRWGLGVGLLGLLTVILLGLVIRGWVNAGRDRHTIARLQEQIAERDSARASAQAFLELAANRSTRDQSQFLNGLIRQKAFSWTRVFEELERVMPNELHVASLRPQVNEQNQVELEMKVVCQTRAAAVELVHRMEGSKHFQGSQLVQESQGDNPAAGVTATVSAIYVPDPASKSGK